MYISFDMLCTYNIYAYNMHISIEASLYLNLISQLEIFEKCMRGKRKSWHANWSNAQ